jgi:hypothetical protein
LIPGNVILIEREWLPPTPQQSKDVVAAIRRQQLARLHLEIAKAALASIGVPWPS